MNLQIQRTMRGSRAFIPAAMAFGGWAADLSPDGQDGDGARRGENLTVVARIDVSDEQEIQYVQAANGMMLVQSNIRDAQLPTSFHSRIQSMDL